MVLIGTWAFFFMDIYKKEKPLFWKLGLGYSQHEKGAGLAAIVETEIVVYRLWYANYVVLRSSWIVLD